jgi:hypothetical protein
LCQWYSICRQAGQCHLRNTWDIQSLYCEEPSSSWPSNLMTQGLKFIVRLLMILWVWCTFIKWRVLLPFYLHVHLGYIRRTYSWCALKSWCEMEVKMHFLWRWVKAKRYANIIFSSCSFIFERHFKREYFQNIPGITLLLRNTIQCNHWSYISLKIISLYSYMFLPVAVKSLETFLESILWKPFHPFLRILISDTRSIKHPKCIAPSTLISIVETGKN